MALQLGLVSSPGGGAQEQSGTPSPAHPLSIRPAQVRSREPCPKA